MDFGKVADLSKVNFSLPDDADFTQQVLKQYHPSTPQILIGAPVWSNKEWNGKIYPANCKPAEMLYHYSRQFNTIELNLTHYKIPDEDTIRFWKETVPESFRFCPKWPQAISHDSMLRGLDSLKQEFIKAAMMLEGNLGTTFLQLGPAFDTRYMPVLDEFIKILPEGFPIALEFRHPDWFSDQQKFNRLLAYLHRKNVGMVITDVAGRRDVLHMGLSTPHLTLRFVGYELHPTDYTRSNDWILRLKKWFAAGLQSATLWVHCGENFLAPELIQYWIGQLNQELNLTLQPPVIRPNVVQGSLF
jgi:uncharacterized protein YecE (DUF72 family)